MEYTMLKDLNDTHDTWRIRVRICRLWDSTNPQKNGELISIDMIFIDEKENLMHATIKKHLASRFRHLLQEGSTYSIKNLQVVKATGDYRPLSSEFKCIFLATTSPKKLQEDTVQIPRHGFQFVMPDDIESRLNDPAILTDVVGLLSGIGEVDIVGNNWKKRDLHIITNHSVNATITLWGKHIEQFDPKIYKEEDSPHIIIVTSTTIKKFKGAVSFNSTNNSKIYMNLDIPYVMTLRERFAQHSTKLKFIESSNSNKYTLEEKMFFHRMSIKELEYVVTVKGEIFEIDNQFGWYYVACKSCGKKVEAEDGDYKCCNKIIDYPLVMFKVHVHIKDHTGTTTLTLFNNIVERLLDTSAKKLVNKLTSGDSDLPKELNTLIGKEFIYRLRLNHYNFKQGYANYTVSETYEPRKCLEHEYESKKALEVCSYGGNKVEGGVKPTVEVRKRRKMVVLDDDDDDDANDNGDAN
ncbi:hypothetical protein DCAR_0310434 [Daucus carota subsp. sativus]|uniref:DUF223 domain-containing protein n=1 Tax=Daucus carota subsp. sativus TaxID=79200 RepID=A0AAF1ASW7_DAUCS|nr:hypothetical protein DCAR_0310434 [Daucus carota subsp. sativus]